MKRLVNKFFVHLRQKGLRQTALKTGSYLTSLDNRLPHGPQPHNPDMTAPEEALHETSKTAAKWDKSDEVYSIAGFKVYWELLEEVQRYQNLMMTEGRDLVEYLSSFFPKGNRSGLTGLIIGCNYGEASPPIALAKSGAFKRLLVVDIAKGLLGRQSQISSEMGLNHILEYKCMDLNRESLTGENSYDFIFALGTIHHIGRLEGLFSEINGCLRKGGIFCMREYIGPSFLQYTDKQIHIANRVLGGLPDYLKMQGDGSIKKEGWKPRIEEIMADDPSEAVRSQDIMRIVRTHTDVLVCRMTGGTILDPLLHGIAGNFERSDASRAILRTIITLEQTLIEEGVIPSDFVFLVAQKR